MKLININNNEIYDFADNIKNGKLIVIPTETVYGLAANALDENAIKLIFKVKGRPQDNPLIIHTYSKENIYKFTKNQPKYIDNIIDKFMPGPITLVLEKQDIIPKIVTAGLKTVGIRIPNHSDTLKFLKIVDLPLAAPSANKSGKPSPTKVEHIFNDYQNQDEIYGIINGGECNVGIESTIIKCEEEKIIILRPGIINKSMIQEIVDVDVIDYNGNEILAPGMKYKHYSPDIPVFITKEININPQVLNLSYNGKIENTFSFNEKNIYSIFREVDKNFNSINIVLTKELTENKALYNRILKASEKS